IKPYLTPLLIAQNTGGETPEELTTAFQTNALEKISATQSNWVAIIDRVPQEIKDTIASESLTGVGFDQYIQRSYKEASMAAQVVGFVGKNKEGDDAGYFGVEGALEKELQGKSETETVATDALGKKIGSVGFLNEEKLRGRDIVLTIRRDIQYMAETQLKQGMRRYGAKEGEVLIMNPHTGAILGWATYPNYNPQYFYAYPSEYYKNPSLADMYEPGSTFKVLTVAAGIDAGVITPETSCPRCSGPRNLGGYELKTWNEVYTPGITMNQGLAKSDNTAMIYIAELLGSERLLSYLTSFGIGQPIGIDMQEDTSTPFPEKLGVVELATTSFGQGIGTTSMQLVRAVSAIANTGQMVQPRIIEGVIDTTTGERIPARTTTLSTPISAQTATTVTEMMVNAAGHGEAQWTRSRTHTVAGKTGTSQIAVQGGYDEDKTIASFVGFAPAYNPEFVMLVKLSEPTTSTWASETATPLWYDIADQLFLLLNIPPDLDQNTVFDFTLPASDSASVGD
ncbi:penicillin-binding protein 2, partial [Candidatus Woesebacteria bacterium]|nr:penicillin-binding protein 2 [Candidatus Woesebacteria bacterium]